MKLILQTLLLLLPLCAMQAQQLAITAVVTEPTCNQNGQICLRVTGGTRPYRYDLDSIGGSIHLSQDDSCFTGRGRGTYQVRVTDFLGRKDSTFVTIVTHYVPMVLAATAAGSCVTLTVTGGRKPYRYYRSSFNGGQRTPIDSAAVEAQNKTICCLYDGTHGFEVEDSCHNFYPTSVVIPYIASPWIRIDTVSHGDSLDISLIRSEGGEPPYTYVCNGDVRGTRSNTTGSFTGLKGCGFVLYVKDKCGRESIHRRIEYSNPPILFPICINSDSGTASFRATGGTPPFLFSETSTQMSNATGQFTGLPVQRRYHFNVTDACGKMQEMYSAPMNAWNSWNSCPFTGKIDLYSQHFGTWQQPYSFYPVTYTCTNCTPITTLVDSGAQGSSTSNVQFQNMVAGDYHFKIVNRCGETREMDVRTDTGSLYISGVRLCNFNQVAAQNSNGDFFILKDKWGNPLDSNWLGRFPIRNSDTLIITARGTNCLNEASVVIPPQFLNLSATLNCDARTITATTDGGYPTFFLRNKIGQLLDSNQTGRFQVPTVDTYRMSVRNRSCTEMEMWVYPPVAQDTAIFCLELSNSNNPFVWNIRCSPAQNRFTTHSYRIRGGQNNINLFQNDYFAVFSSLLPGTYILEYDCKSQIIVLPTPDTPNYRISIQTTFSSCPQTPEARIQVTAMRSQTWYQWALQQHVTFCRDTPKLRYILRDSVGFFLGDNTTGFFYINPMRHHLYQLFTFFNGILLQKDTILFPFYERPTLTAVFDPVCIGNSSSRASIQVNGGVPPYTLEWTQPLHVRPARTVDSNIILFDNLPLGTYTIRVVDRCRISADITGSIAPLTVTARYRRECHNHLVLITNELRNAKYRWTNRRGDSIGNTPILTFRNAPVDSQTYQVTIFWKNCQWTSRVYVPRNDLQIIQNQIDTMICEEDFITLNGHVFPKAGVFRDTFLNQKGCDSVLILNLRKQNCGYELPNAFAPEMGFLYTLYPNLKVAQIEQLSIFDRWGNKIYESEGTFVSGQTGWDGTFQGQLVDAGVFVAVARIVYKNGTHAVLKTDLNVIY